MNEGRKGCACVMDASWLANKGSKAADLCAFTHTHTHTWRMRVFTAPMEAATGSVSCATRSADSCTTRNKSESKVRRL